MSPQVESYAAAYRNRSEAYRAIGDETSAKEDYLQAMQREDPR